MASVTVPLTSYLNEPVSSQITWSDNQPIGSDFALDGVAQIIDHVALRYNATGFSFIRLVGTNNRFTTAFEASGRIIFTASDGETLELVGLGGDMSEPYNWQASNFAEAIIFANHIRGLTDHDATLTLTDDPDTNAPSFTDNTGDAQSWTQNTPITNITVPEADGFPVPTYAVAGGLPAGVNFNTTTRVISGTPTASGSGIIRVRAANSEGTADWTVAYVTAAELTAPVFSDNSGDAQAWIQNSTITPVTVPSASGNPTPSYATVGALPAGIQFNTTTRVISGTPTVVSTGTIRIRATNSVGSDDWTVAYFTNVAPVLLTLSDFNDTGLEVETAALLEASDTGALGNNFYVDSSRGGSDTPIEGELGVGTGETVISRMRRASEANLTLNDNDLPVALDFGVFFGTGGAGRDLTVYLQTQSDGLVSFTVASAFLSAGDNWLNVVLPVTGRTLLNNLENGDRFIFALARPEVVVTPPSFTDNTGNAQSWTQNTPITNITVPAADGSPTPSYAAVGSLPAGINFDGGTRVLSGTPTGSGSGTITIRATNSAGSADWTVAYNILVALSTDDWDGSGYQTPIVLALVPVVISDPNITDQDFTPIGTGDIVVASNLSIGQIERYVSGTLRLERTSASSAGMSTYFDNEGSPRYPDAKLFLVIRDSSANVLVTIPFTIASTGFTFNNWTIDDNDLFALVSGLQTGDTFVLAIAEPLVAPTFADNTGDSQTWTQNAAIAPVTVPAANGSPTPTYAAVGALPDGIVFDAATRVFSGIPTTLGSGTIRIRAMNSEGTADWTVAYSTIVLMSAPSFTDSTGDAQTWMVGTSIAAVTVPVATGNPAPSYAVVGSLPVGIQFNTITRVLSGIPTASGSGTITIQATNSEGSANWTVAYNVADTIFDLSILAETGIPEASFEIRAIDASASIQLAIDASSGIPNASFNLKAIPPGVRELEIEANSGIPEVMLNLRVIDSSVLTLAITSNSGTPEASFEIENIPPAEALTLHIDARSGIPTAMLELADLPPSSSIPLSITANSGTPEASFVIQVVPPASALTLAIEANSGTPVVQFNPRVITPDVLRLKIEARSGIPTASFNERIITPDVLALHIDADSGTPVASFEIRALPPSAPIPLAITSNSGTPFVQLNLRVIDPNVLTLDIVARSGIPTASFNERIIPPAAPIELEIEANSGTPVVQFNPRVLPPSASIPLAIEADAGLPTASFEARVIDPDVLSLVIRANAGIPTASFEARVIPLVEALTLQIEANAGTPVVSFNPRVIDPSAAIALALTSNSGTPFVELNLRAIDPTDSLTLSIRAYAGIPVASFNPRAIIPIHASTLAIVANAGIPNSSFNVRVIVAPEALPRQVFVPETLHLSDNVVLLYWLKPRVDLGGLPIELYDVRYRLVDTTAWRTISDIPDVSYAVGGLLRGRRYAFQVRSKDTGGNLGDWSVIVTTTLPGDAVFAPASIDLLITEWRTAPRFSTLMRNLLHSIDTYHIQPFLQMDEARRLDTSRGVWLDYWGERLDLPRPNILSTNVAFFGFTTAGDSLSVGFDQGIMHSINPVLMIREPIGDAWYLPCLQLRQGYLLSDGSSSSIRALLRAVFPNANYIDNQDMSATINMGGIETGLFNVIRDFNVVQAPASVLLTLTNL